jgi:hypothetical protein
MPLHRNSFDLGDSSSSFSTSPRSSQDQIKQVRFDKVQVRSFNVILSDTPSYDGGPPIGLGWECVSEEFAPVDEFGHFDKRPLAPLNAKDRCALMLEAGFTRCEIEKAASLARLVQRQRSSTRYFE